MIILQRKTQRVGMRYEKGRKDATRQRIIEVAAERFRVNGIAATGLASIMSDAGLTNGAFYPYFKSKAALVGESVSAALDGQSELIKSMLVAGGPNKVIDTYLSPEHRDNPGKGCASSALLPELGRESPENRQLYAAHVLPLVQQLAVHLDPQFNNREDAALSIFAMLVGTLQLARAVDDADLSDRILATGASAARMLARAPSN
jgi:TetR/AcrR family transcriptional regulator, transcriptional repressor for nem operon